ncbi:MAG: hypothetical protein WBF53_12025 [Litorimonas sp.]
MQADLIARLRADATLAGALARHDGRSSIDLVTRPDRAAMPGMTVTEVNTNIDYNQSGATSWRETLIQFDIYAATAGETIAASNALTALLHAEATVGATRFSRGYLDSARQMRAEDTDGGERVHRRSIDFRLVHRPA